MGKVISVRINENLEEIIKRHSKEKGEDQSEVVRKLINNGSIYLAIKKYAKGKFSLGKAAYLANLPLSEFIEVIKDLGIRSKIDKDEILEGYENLKQFMRKYRNNRFIRFLLLSIYNISFIIVKLI